MASNTITDAKIMAMRREIRRAIRRVEGDLTDAECDDLMRDTAFRDMLRQFDRPPVTIWWGMWSQQELDHVFA